jgi:hypothetical protein
MQFYFVRDYRGKYRYFSSESALAIPAKLSKPKQAWELAKKKLMILPTRILRQEQAFERALRLRLRKRPIVIRFAEPGNGSKIRDVFAAFLKRQLTGHILVLIGEAIVLPFTGFVAILPGPNVVFYALALLMITQWLALRGIRRTINARPEFIPDAGLRAWEEAVRRRDETLYPEILERLAREHGIRHIDKILWNRKRKKRADAGT